MKQTISSRFSFHLHSALVIIGTLAAILLVSSCSKDKITFSNQEDHVDKYMFFTINVDGKEFTSYGYLNKINPSSNTGPTLEYYFHPDSAGNQMAFTSISVWDWSFDLSSGGSIFERLGDCSLKVIMTKPDQGLAGIYNIRAGIDNNIWGYGNVISVGKGADTVTYAIDSSGLELTVRGEGRHPGTGDKTIEGSFSCKVFRHSNPARLIPATCTFRMYTN